MKSMLYAALLSAALPIATLAQTADELKNAEKTPQSVLTYGMSYNQQRFSPLSQINRDTVKRLVPSWSYSMNNNTGEESQPLIYNSVMYVTSQNKTVAVDALSGKEIWNTPVEYPADTTRVVCCGIVNRGAANAGDITALMDMTRERVQGQFGISLEPEIRVMGEG